MNLACGRLVVIALTIGAAVLIYSGLPINELTASGSALSLLVLFRSLLCCMVWP